jgi:hypothetical protein
MNAADEWNRQDTVHPTIIPCPPPLSRNPYTEEIITASKMEARTSQNYIRSKRLVIPVRNTLLQPV